MRVFFTGGSGKAGREVIAYLLQQGHRVLNADLLPLDMPGVDNLAVDVTDVGQVFGAMSGYASLDEVRARTGVPKFDAVVHFAAIPRILLRTDSETFRINTMATFNVMEVAVKLGVQKVVFASSETVYGMCFADGIKMPTSVPVTEETVPDPVDAYGMSKLCSEQLARSFQARSGIDIYGLRISCVIGPNDYGDWFAQFQANIDRRARDAFGYIDARDLGQVVDLCLKKHGLGFQIFNAANDSNAIKGSSVELVKRFYPDVLRVVEITETTPIYSNQKIREVLGFVEQHPWTKYAGTKPRR